MLEIDECPVSISLTKTFSMIKNYLKIAGRNLLKHKSLSFINIAGLATGIAACIIIFLYVHYELGFDQYNLKADRIARISTHLYAPGSDMQFGTCPVMLAPRLQKDFPSIENTVRLEPAPKVTRLNNEFIREENFYKADQSVFAIFSFNFIEGSPAGALDNIQSIVLTKSIAKKYFGNTTALGKTMHFDNLDFIVKGVIEDRPANSDIKIDALITQDFSASASWMDDFTIYTFVLFRTKNTVDHFNKQLAAVGKNYARADLDAQGADKYHMDFLAEPLNLVHFSKGKLVDTPKGNRQFIYVFSILAIFILCIALLNYINLATVKAAERAKEVGIRKVSGAMQHQLVIQFLSESALIVAIACLLATVMVLIALPIFNHLLQIHLSFAWQEGVLYIGTLFFVCAIIAGLYPAFSLSRFKPAAVLKGNWRYSAKGVLLRKTVTFIQFSIAAGLILGTTVIFQQIRFIENKDLGFNKDHLLNIYLPRDSIYQTAVNAFRHAIDQRPEVTGMTSGSGMVADGMTIGSVFVEAAGGKKEFVVNYYAIDPQFVPLFQLQMSEGRNLSDSFGTDKNQAFLVNEAFVQRVGWKTALNQPLEGWEHKGKVIGVVKNFYYKSLHSIIEPLVMVYNIFPVNTTTVKIKPKDLPVVSTLYKKAFPALPFDYAFFDEIINKQYQKDKITMTLFNAFTLLAIAISCLGLYGLVSLLAVKRTREIGIRKVLGASFTHLFSIQVKAFMRLAVLSLVITLPIAAVLMHQWLQNYAYHIELGWRIFIIPVLLLPVITLTVISRQVIEAARVNPVKSLKTE